jgi:hypothetical protein
MKRVRQAVSLQLARQNRTQKEFDEVRSVWGLQHTPSETLGTIEDVLRGRHIRFNYIESHAAAGCANARGFCR